MADVYEGKPLPVDLYVVADVSEAANCPLGQWCITDGGLPPPGETRWANVTSAIERFAAAPGGASVGLGLFPRFLPVSNGADSAGLLLVLRAGSGRWLTHSRRNLVQDKCLPKPRGWLLCQLPAHPWLATSQRRSRRRGAICTSRSPASCRTLPRILPRVSRSGWRNGHTLRLPAAPLHRRRLPQPVCSRRRDKRASPAGCMIHRAPRIATACKYPRRS